MERTAAGHRSHRSRSGRTPGTHQLSALCSGVEHDDVINSDHDEDVRDDDDDFIDDDNDDDDDDDDALVGGITGLQTFRGTLRHSVRGTCR